VKAVKQQIGILWLVLGMAVFMALLGTVPALAQAAPIVPRITVGVDAAENPEDVALSLQILILLTILSLAPAILVMMTSFTRIVVVLSFVRNALATNQMPPNQVLIGLALFLTFFVMAPTWQTVNETALQPYLQGELPQREALDRAIVPIREFMVRNTREKDLELFVSLSKAPRPGSQTDVPTHVIVPAFVISELKTAFQLGFIIFIPFIVIDTDILFNGIPSKSIFISSTEEIETPALPTSPTTLSLSAS